MSNESDDGLVEGLGFLSLLDDKLDELERAGRLSRPQWQEQFVGGGFEEGATVQPIAPGCGQRQPLRDAVRDLTIQWSEAILALAYESNAACCSLVAQMSFRPGGYGSIPYNKAAGLQWIFKAIDAGDFESRMWARRVAMDDYLRHLVRKDKGDAILTDPARAKELADAIEEWRIKDKELEAEEKRLEAEREKAEGE